jgi:hypothetical protein
MPVGRLDEVRGRRIGVALGAITLIAACSTGGQLAVQGRVPVGHSLSDPQPSSPGPDRVDGGAAEMAYRPTPKSMAIAGAVDLYSDGNLVLAATTHGISRSVDGGRRWHSVLHGYEMASVGHGPTGYFAVGTTHDLRRDATATSSDGVTWKVVVDHPAAGQAGFPLAFGSAAVVVGDVGVEAVVQNRLLGAEPMMRTTDGGRRWTVVSDMKDAEGGLHLLPDGSLVATAEGNPDSCAGSVWRSTDLGATWRELPSSCSRLPLTAVQFTSATTGMAVGGAEQKIGGGQVIETTDDGGLHWTVTHYVPTCTTLKCQAEDAVDGLAAVHLLTPHSGFVLEGLTPDSLAGPCAGTLLWTGDDGRSLTALKSSPSSGWLSVVETRGENLVGAPSDSCTSASSAIGLSTDSGRHWRFEAPPGDFSSNVGVALVGAGTHLLWQTPVGMFGSHDAGRHWSQAGNPKRARRQLRAYRARLGTTDTAVRSSFGATRWTSRCLVQSPRCLVAYRANTEAAWIQHLMPRWYGDFVPTIVATGQASAVFVGRGADLWRTNDGGATWRESWPKLPGEGRQ